MSKVVKSVKKVFKKVINVVKKVIVPIVAVAAVIWTAGAALGAFASAGSVLGTVGGALQAAGGAVLGGIKAAASGIYTMVAKGVSAATSFVKGALGISGPGVPGTAANTTGVLSNATLNSGVLSSAGTGAGATGAAGSGFWAGLKGMSAADKLVLGSTVANTAGGLMAPDAEDIAEAQAKHRGHQGAFYGVNADGSGGGETQSYSEPGAAQNPADLFSQQSGIAPTNVSDHTQAIRPPRPAPPSPTQDLFQGLPYAA